MREVRYALAGLAGHVALTGLFSTMRFTRSGVEHHQRFRSNGQPVIFVLWHGRLLPLTYYHRDEDVVTLVSRSGDGEYITRVIQRWGYEVVRGSSSRAAGPALRQMVRHIRAGRSLAITPDGPRGPRQKLKPGALLAAQLSGAPLIPAAGAARRSWWFGSWDRFLVPQPFTRVWLRYGEPRFISRDLDAAGLEQARIEVETALNQLQDGVDAEAAGR